jgi:hypothetical protein
MSPGRMSMLTLRTAVTRPKRQVMCAVSASAADAAVMGGGLVPPEG